jgi:dihydroxyacetone kinase-like predicted kinase
MVRVLDFYNLKNMLIGGASELKKNIAIVNELNVFPVPDGDTGTNMLKTFEGGVKAVINLSQGGASELLSAFSSGAMLGARGNSGVILSEFIKGFAKEVKGESLTVQEIKSALNSGVKCAYDAVETPVEGTILTVIKKATEYVCSHVDDKADIIELLSKHFEIAQKTSARFIINSDAHSVGRVGDIKIVEEQLSRIEFPLHRIDNIDGRLPTFRFAEYKKNDK